ncbi:MAG TPA: tetratricopeptide repeat protein, partial [Nitrososphaeraceae archaeon]|nr:tetratricopeptide repeat protein [Nitrososphaeraceae archaeon]
MNSLFLEEVPCEEFNAEETFFPSLFPPQVDQPLKKFLDSESNNNAATNLGKLADINDLINNGNLLLSKGENYEAIKYYDAVLEREPTNKYALNNKGIALYNEGKIKEAGLYYNKAISIDHVFYDALYNMGLVQLDSSSYKSAKDCFKRALEIKPDSVDALNSLGVAEMENGIELNQMYAEATRTWNQWIAIMEDVMKDDNTTGTQIKVQFTDRDDSNINSAEKILMYPLIVTLQNSIQRYDMALEPDADNINLINNKVKEVEKKVRQELENSIQNYDIALGLKADNINIMVNKIEALYE